METWSRAAGVTHPEGGFLVLHYSYIYSYINVARTGKFFAMYAWISAILRPCEYMS